MANTTIGYNPIEQQYSDTCAIKSQQIIMQDFGIPVTEDQLVMISSELGIYNAGTVPEHVGILLNEAGIPVTQTENATIFDLTNELAQGHKIIIGVDSGELWARDTNVWEQFKEWWEDLWGNEIADHALIVSSIDNSNPDDPRVQLIDPGTGEIRYYPLDQFMDAWKDSGCFMVSTDVAPAEFTAIQIQNEQPTMHLSDIAGVNYNDFQLFHDMSQALPAMSLWDYTENPYHPVHSLMDAYFLYGHDTIGFSDFNQFDFYPHLDPMQFNTGFEDTFRYNYDFLSQDYQNELTDMQSFLVQHQNAMDAYNYFNQQAEYFELMHNTQMADFYSQQANYMDLCQDMNINPMDTYSVFF